MRAVRRRIRRANANDWAVLQRDSIQAHETRQLWYDHRPPRRSKPLSPTRRAGRSMRLSSEAQYIRAFRTLTNDPIADLEASSTITALSASHHAPTSPIIPLAFVSLPLAPDITESSALRAIKRVNPTNAAGSDSLLPRLFHLLVDSKVSPEAGDVGLSYLTRLAHRLSGRDFPDAAIPTIAAATLIPVRPRPDETRPIAIGQALQRLVTKVLLLPPLADTEEYLRPQKILNGRYRT